MKKGLVFCFLLILISSGVFASFEVGNLSHALTQTSYGPGTTINGWINLSLNNERSTSVFTSSQNNSITLIDLLKKNTNSGVAYSCNPADCSSDYIAANPEDSKTFNLDAGDSKIVGIVFTQNIESIDNVSFVIQSDATSHCLNQLEIDFLNDGVINRGNNQSSGGYCSENHGCFDDSRSTSEYTIGKLNSNKHCQRFNLSKAPGFKLGAWVNENADPRTLQVGLYRVGGEFINNCTLVEDEAMGVDYFSCDIDYLVTEPEEAYVCIYSESETGDATIRGYGDSLNGCGFYGGSIGGTEDYAFDIFIKSKRFGDIGTLEIENPSLHGDSLATQIQYYIGSTYGDTSCSTTPCHVPIKFNSSKDQTITIDQIEIGLTTTGGETTINSFHDFVETPSKITSDFHKIFLDEAGFVAGQAYGNSTFSLFLRGSKIFSENISIERIPEILYLFPTTTAYGFPTEFAAVVNASPNTSISNYKWEFEGNENQTTSTNKITHTYNSSGQYLLKLTITDSMQKRVSKTFNISVVSPEAKINESLSKIQQDLVNIKAEIEDFDLVSQERLNSFLDLENTETTLTELQIKFTQADSQQEYFEIIDELLTLDVPESIIKTRSVNSLLYYPSRSLIDLNLIDAITNETRSTDNEANYLDSILDFNQRKIETKITFRGFSKRTNSVTEPLLNVFEIDITEREFLDSNPFLIFKNLADLKFKTNYGEEEISGSTYIELTDSQRVVFSTTESIDFTNLPIFVSPALSTLNLSQDGTTAEERSKWTLFALLIALLLVIGISAYFIMNVWYKKKYESHLFPNKRNLYNMHEYVSRSKRRGVEDKEIINGLKKAKWNSEQISYVMKKFTGKRTGMYEIPIGKTIDLFKKKEAPRPTRGPIPRRRGLLKRKFRRKPY